MRLGRLGPPVPNGRNLRLRPGDVVTVRRGSARVSLPGGGHLDLREASSVRFSGGPVLEAGDLLVQSASTPVRVDGGIADLTVAGAARLSHGLALDVGTYKGQTTVSSGRTLTVGWLRQVTIPSVGVAPEPVPLRLSASDPWDTQFLGQAIDLTSELDSRSSYVNANAQSGTGSATFYQRALHPLASDVSFDDALLKSASPAGAPAPGDALVAASIALSGAGPFDNRWHAVFDLRAQGAQWGVVVLDQRADPTKVLGLLDGAVTTSAVTPTIAVLAESAPGPEPTVANPAVTAPGAIPTTTSTAPKGTRRTTTTTSPPRTSPTQPPPTVPLTVPTIPQPQSSPPTPTPTPIPTPPPPLAPILDPVVGIMHSLGLGGS